MQPNRTRNKGGTGRGDGNRVLGPSYALQGYFNYFGEVVDGDLTTPGAGAGNITWTANSGTNVIKQFSQLKISAGDTITSSASGWTLVLVDGNCTINGSLVTTSGASAIATAINLKTYDVNGLTGAFMERAALVTNTIPLVGAAGGTGSTAGAPGGAGSNGQTGGGAGGVGSTLGGANGSAGTAFSGGAAGGAANSGSATAGGINGGAGGTTGVAGTNNGLGGAAGNPGSAGTSNGTGTSTPGTTGTGGILILLVKGTLTLGSTSTITCNGYQGGNATTVASIALGGGGSGGGSSIILYGQALSNLGASITSSGGPGGVATGGTPKQGQSGGAGSIQGPTQIGI